MCLPTPTRRWRAWRRADGSGGRPANREEMSWWRDRRIERMLRKFRSSSGNNHLPLRLFSATTQGEKHMPYVALEWDHKIGRPMIQWLVVKCQSVGQKFGGPQALPPRRDVAYFVDEQTAERDAKAFAAYKTELDANGAPEAAETPAAY